MTKRSSPNVNVPTAETAESCELHVRYVSTYSTKLLRCISAVFWIEEKDTSNERTDFDVFFFKRFFKVQIKKETCWNVSTDKTHLSHCAHLSSFRNVLYFLLWCITTKLMDLSQKKITVLTDCFCPRLLIFKKYIKWMCQINFGNSNCQPIW